MLLVHKESESCSIIIIGRAMIVVLLLLLLHDFALVGWAAVNDDYVDDHLGTYCWTRNY